MDETKVCTKCGERHPTSDFYSHSTTRDKLGSWCKKCVNETSRDRRVKHPERQTRIRNKSRYRLTDNELDDLPKTCGICGSTKSLDIDHEHIFGMIRGVLCRSCNVGLGMFKDDPELIKKAIHYLNNWPVGRCDG